MCYYIIKENIYYKWGAFMNRYVIINNASEETIKQIYNLINGIYKYSTINNNIISFLNDKINIVDVLKSYISDLMINIKIIVLEPLDEIDLSVVSWIMDLWTKSNLNDEVITEKEILRHCINKSEYEKKHILKSYYNDYELKQIINEMANNNLNVSKASEMLFMHRNTLINKLERFNKATNYDLKSFNDFIIIYNLIH